jgi:hypothetical protein
MTNGFIDGLEFAIEQLERQLELSRQNNKYDEVTRIEHVMSLINMSLGAGKRMLKDFN